MNSAFVSSPLYFCRNCRQVVSLLGNGTVPTCCHEKMQNLKARDREDKLSVEKHLPIFQRDSEFFRISVGSVLHPMQKNHWITWIELGFQDFTLRSFLRDKESPVIFLPVINSKPLWVSAFCNLHGLWTTTIEEDK